MGLDIEKLRQKLKETQERQNRGGGTDFEFWQPKDGRNVIRILPPKPGTDDFYAETKVHYNVGPKKKMVVCRKTTGESCVICDFIDELFATKEKADASLAKRMIASSRYYYNIIDRSVEPDDEEYGKILVYGSGVTVFQDILSIIVDPEFGDITDPEVGRDVIINKTGKELKTEYKVQARPVQTPIGIDDWAEKLVDLSIFIKPKSNEDLEKILNGEEPEKDSDSSDDEKPKVSSKKKSPVEEEDNDDEPAVDGSFDDENEDDIEKEIQAMLNKHKK